MSLYSVTVVSPISMAEEDMMEIMINPELISSVFFDEGGEWDYYDIDVGGNSYRILADNDTKAMIERLHSVTSDVSTT